MGKSVFSLLQTGVFVKHIREQRVNTCGNLATKKKGDEIVLGKHYFESKFSFDLCAGAHQNGVVAFKTQGNEGTHVGSKSAQETHSWRSYRLRM